MQAFELLVELWPQKRNYKHKVWGKAFEFHNANPKNPRKSFPTSCGACINRIYNYLVKSAAKELNSDVSNTLQRANQMNKQNARAKTN